MDAMISMSLPIPCKENKLISMGTNTSDEAISALMVNNPRLGGQSMTIMSYEE